MKSLSDKKSATLLRARECDLADVEEIEDCAESCRREMMQAVPEQPLHHFHANHMPSLLATICML